MFDHLVICVFYRNYEIDYCSLFMPFHSVIPMPVLRRGDAVRDIPGNIPNRHWTTKQSPWEPKADPGLTKGNQQSPCEPRVNPWKMNGTPSQTLVRRWEARVYGIRGQSLREPRVQHGREGKVEEKHLKYPNPGYWVENRKI
jgi:hypothetical protein